MQNQRTVVKAGNKINTLSKWLFLAVLLVPLFSCDPVKYIAINNNEHARLITVTYNPKAEIYWESDTLNAGYTGDKYFDTVIVRQNIDSTTYSFIAPANRHIELMPKGKGDVIARVVIAAGKAGEPPLEVNLTDKEELKRLEKEGVIQWYGPYSDLIIINKGTPPEPEEMPEPEQEAPAETIKSNE